MPLAIFVSALLLLSFVVPQLSFQVPRQRLVEASAPAKKASASSRQDQSKTSPNAGSGLSTNQLVGVVEILCGLGIVAVANGVIPLRGQRQVSSQARQTAMRSKAWLAPGTQTDLVGTYGVTEPCGEKGQYYWDPANLAENMGPSKFRAFRAAEIKHGRVCMLATLGWLVQEEVRIPWLTADKAPNGFSALSYFLNLPRDDDDQGTAGAASFLLISIVVACGYIERNTSDEGRDPGDFGDPANWYGWNQGLNAGGGGINGSMDLFRDCEINHCRLAMIGILAAASAEYSGGLSEITAQWAGTNAFALGWFKSLPLKLLPPSMY
jgi:hypothetical protein